MTLLFRPLFVFFTVFSVFIWALPISYPNARCINALLTYKDLYLRPMVHDFITLAGIDQTWSMFVHRPNQPNIWLDTWFEIEYKLKNQVVGTEVFPRVRDMSFWQSWSGFRYRKFLDYSPSTKAVFDRMAVYRLENFKRTQGINPDRVEIYQTSRRLTLPGVPEETFQRYFIHKVDLHGN